METNRLHVTMAFVIGFGAGSLFISWFTLSQNQNTYSALAQRVEQVNTHLSGFEHAFDAMSAELRQLRTALNNNDQFYADDPVVPSIYQHDNGGLSNINADANTDSADNDQPTLDKADTLSAQELSRVTWVVDRLRAQDAMAFPDFPSLMTSPEVANMSPAALDKVMAEVSRMVEQGQLAPSFFPDK